MSRTKLKPDQLEDKRCSNKGSYVRLPGVLFESEESLLRDAVKRRQTADCEQELSSRLRQESGYFYQDPFESRSVAVQPLHRAHCCMAHAQTLNQRSCRPLFTCSKEKVTQILLILFDIDKLSCISYRISVYMLCVVVFEGNHSRT